MGYTFDTNDLDDWEVESFRIIGNTVNKIEAAEMESKQKLKR